MAHLMANDFSSFSVTVEEEIAGRMLTTAQIWNIQNQLSEAANKRINTRMDPLNPFLKALEEASLDGEINILRRLLNESKEAITISSDNAKQAAEVNQPNLADQIFIVTPPQPASHNPTKM